MNRIATLAAAVALLTGCGADHTTGSTADATGVAAPIAATNQSTVPGSDESKAEVERDLATLRSVTARFQNFDTAFNAGWSAQITGCMVDPAGAGGMGFHYGNPNVIDGVARVDEPEVLLYEPEANGRLRLVAVEYVIPYSVRGPNEAPPRLFGLPFLHNEAFHLWGLHAWVWSENPSGVFADWNPRVNCEHAASRSVMSHG